MPDRQERDTTRDSGTVTEVWVDLVLDQAGELVTRPAAQLRAPPPPPPPPVRARTTPIPVIGPSTDALARSIADQIVRDLQARAAPAHPLAAPERRVPKFSSMAFARTVRATDMPVPAAWPPPPPATPAPVAWQHEQASRREVTSPSFRLASSRSRPSAPWLMVALLASFVAGSLTYVHTAGGGITPAARSVQVTGTKLAHQTHARLAAHLPRLRAR